MWISIPIPENEQHWLEQIASGWRNTAEGLVRQSHVELALVPYPDTWERWHLPTPRAPIISIPVANLDRVTAVLAEGARWEKPIASTPWGVVAGFLRFPSGFLVEIILEKEPGTST